ncbi:MAG TPA: GtrA family protein [Trebonia sp.]|nr:GtrA family protein [Trebonia sp.]
MTTQLERPAARLKAGKTAAPRHKAAGMVEAIRRNRMRIVLATVNGLIAFVFGLAVGTAFIRLLGLERVTAYIISNVFSTQLSFLLARYVTWRDRRVRFFSTLARYNAQQVTTTVLSILMFAVLDRLGMNYAAANFIVTVTVAPLSFLIAHNWSIAERGTPGKTAG